MLWVTRHGELFNPVREGEKLTAATKVHVYVDAARPEEQEWQEWHTEPGCVPSLKRVTATVGALLQNEGSYGCSECTLPARLHFTVKAATREDTCWALITCYYRLNPNVKHSCTRCEVLVDVAGVTDLELVTLHAAPHRGLLARIPGGLLVGYDLIEGLVLSSLHHDAPPPAPVDQEWPHVDPTALGAHHQAVREHAERSVVADLDTVDREVLVLADAMDPWRALGTGGFQLRQLYLDVATAVRNPPNV